MLLSLAHHTGTHNFIKSNAGNFSILLTKDHKLQNCTETTFALKSLAECCLQLGIIIAQTQRADDTGLNEQLQQVLFSIY